MAPKISAWPPISPSICGFVLIACTLTFGISERVTAADYRCVIAKVIKAESPQLNVPDGIEKNYIGKEFTVERRSGLMAGALKNAYHSQPEVIDPGGGGNSYKVITSLSLKETGIGSNVYVLVVNEYVESEQKPFVFLENDVTYFGTCKHF